LEIHRKEKIYLKSCSCYIKFYQR